MSVETRNALDLHSLAWRKSSFSNGNGGACVEVGASAWRTSSFSDGQGGNCVEVAPTSTLVAIRDSKDRSGPALTFSASEWAAFLSGIRAGEFDLT